MKIQSLAVIFAIIILPIVIILSYFIHAEVDTIAIQTGYDTKLIDSTHDAMAALEINTANEDLSSVTTFISGGDFLTPSRFRSGKQFFHLHGAHDVEIGNGSGNAETVSCGTNPTGIKIRPETAGKILVGTDAMIVDAETMEEKKYGEEGLLCVSGEHVFKGYYKEPELTRQSKIIKNGKEYLRVVREEVTEARQKDMPSRLNARRRMMKKINKVKDAEGKNVDLTSKLFNEIAPKYT